jgi:hypothetical protein
MAYVKAFFKLSTILGLWVYSATLHSTIPFTNFEIYGWHVYLFATICRFSPFALARRWGEAYWLWTDQGVNVFHGGDEDITISSSVGKKHEDGDETGTIMAKVINFFWYLGTGQKNHCISAIERDEEHHR